MQKILPQALFPPKCNVEGRAFACVKVPFTPVRFGFVALDVSTFRFTAEEAQPRMCPPDCTQLANYRDEGDICNAKSYILMSH